MTTRMHGSLRSARVLPIFMAVGALLVALAWADGKPAAAAEAWEKEWKQLIVKAKAEGKLTVALGSSATRNLRHVYKAFEKKFGIKVTLGGGRGSLVVARLRSERSAGLYAVDLVQIGIASTTKNLLPNNYLAPIPPLFLLPEVKDQSLWFNGHHWWGDPKTKKFVFFYSLPQADSRIVINTNLVNPDDINSYYDLLHPRYDGMRASGPMELFGVGHSITMMWMMVGKDWLRRWITESKPAYAADSDIIINWLIEGKYGIAMFIGGSADRDKIDDLRKKGAPILRMTKIMKEGADSNPGSSGTFTVIKNAPHPNALKLFVNWFLSKEGQLVMQNGYSKGDSLRIDIPKDMLDPRWRRKKGAKYRVITTDPEYAQILAKGMAYVKQLNRSMGIAAPVAKVVTAKITKVKRKGRRISFKVKGGKTHTVRVSGRRTKVSLNGKKISRKKLKVGMTCKFTYPANRERAKSISCK